MPSSAVLAIDSELVLRINLLDDDGKPLVTLPDGASVEFVSDNPDVCVAALRADGKSALLTTLKVGSATIKVSPIGFRQPQVEDTFTVAVVGPKQGSLNLTVGDCCAADAWDNDEEIPS